MRLLLNALFLTVFTFAAAHAEDSLTIDEKLDQQWTQYRATRDLLLERLQQTTLPPAQRQLSRSEWESSLKLTGPYEIKNDDYVKLRTQQIERINAAKVRAFHASLIELAELRGKPDAITPKITNFCQQMPKGGMLHVHPWGTVNRETAKALMSSKTQSTPVSGLLSRITGSQGHATLASEEIRQLSAFGGNDYFHLSPAQQDIFRSYMFLPAGKQSFPRFNAVFYFLGQAIATDADFEKVLMDFAERAVRERVSYVELTTEFDPTLIPLLQKVEAATGLVIRINHSFNRTESIEALDQEMQKVLKFAPNSYLVGIDFLDNEETAPAFEKGQYLYGTMFDSALHRTMHAGEIGDVRNPRDAMVMGSERLGHGVLLNDDPVALEYAVNNRIPVEINLSSNLRLTKVKTIRSHPFLNYLRLGIPVSLSTDDEGIFETDIQHECELAIAQTDINYAELKQMAFNSIETSFAADDTKAALTERLKTDFDAFEARYLLSDAYDPELDQNAQ